MPVTTRRQYRMNWEDLWILDKIVEVYDDGTGSEFRYEYQCDWLTHNEVILLEFEYEAMRALRIEWAAERDASDAVEKDQIRFLQIAVDARRARLILVAKARTAAGASFPVSEHVYNGENDGFKID